MKFGTLTVGAIALAAIAFTAQANEFEGPLKQLAQNEIRAMVSNPAVVDAVKAQNAKNAALDEGKIKELDQTWRAETSAAAKPMITAVLGNSLSGYLKSQKEAGQGLYTEIFVMDNKGLNVGQSDVTSDYWQGDEAKWQKTYQVGADAVHISDVEQDESTQTFQSQVSVPVVDPASKEVIGAVTVGVNVEMLAQ
jgi:hypothetical protein